MTARLPLDIPPVSFQKSDDLWTPPHVFDALALRFDLDVAAPPGGVPWVPADRYFTRDDDGLAQPWEGIVWCNPPYSKPGPWVERLAAHGCGVALLPVDTSTAYWHRWVLTADVFCFVRGRLAFKGDLTGPARFASVLVGWGEPAAAAVARCGLGWVVRKR